MKKTEGPFEEERGFYTGITQAPRKFVLLALGILIDLGAGGKLLAWRMGHDFAPQSEGHWLVYTCVLDSDPAWLPES